MSTSTQHSATTSLIQGSGVSQPDIIDPTQFHASSFEVKMFWSIRWFLLIALTTGYVVSLLTAIVGFFLTRDYRMLVFLSPSALMPFIIYLVPLDDKRYHLKLRKIEVNAEIRTQRLLLKQKRLQQNPTKKQGP